MGGNTAPDDQAAKRLDRQEERVDRIGRADRNARLRSRCRCGEILSCGRRLGLHGSAYSSMSILNPFGRFGSPSSALSPCNPYALHAPVIVDREGRSYGELTVSESNSRRTRIEFLRGWLAAVCRH